MVNITKAIFVLFALTSFSPVFAAEAETVNTERNILGILLSTISESEFGKIVEAIEGMSEQGKGYYKNEYRKIKAQYKVVGLQQKSAREIQRKPEETKEDYKYQQWQFLHEEKCAKCHTLDRVFAEPKTEEEWRICVTRMMQMSPLWITPEESVQIIDEIVKTKEDVIVSRPRKKHYADEQILFVDRCTKCHPVGRILRQDKTGQEWEETVIRMRDNAPELFFDEDIPILVDYLTKRGKIMKDDFGAEMVVKRCLICHEWGRILLERKSKREWEECVRAMRVLTRKELKKDWFTHDDFKIIVDLLVKTQGSG